MTVSFEREQRPSVLLVDDEPDILEALGLVLRRMSLEVTTAASGAKAVELAEKQNFQLMITDIRMPDMDGLELLNAVKALCPGISVIAISAHSDLNTAVDFMKRGGADFLRKPVAMEQLRIAVSSGIAKYRLKMQLHKTEEERDIADAERKKNLHFNETLINTIPSPIYYKNVKGQFIGCNTLYADFICGMRKEDIIGQTLETLWDAIPGDLGRLYHLKDMKFLKDGLETSSEVAMLNAKYELHHYLLYRALIYDENEQPDGMVGIMLDITQRKKSEEALTAAKEVAENAVRARTDFFAHVTHEIRTPLNAVIGLTQLLLNTQLNKEQRSYTDTIAVSGEALLSVIDDILDVAKIESGNLQVEEVPYEIRDCIDSAIQIVAPKLVGKDIELLCDIADNVPDRIVGDLSRVRQIIVNLLNNAVKFTNSGEIELSAQTVAEEENEYVIRFALRDTGIGIDECKISEIFEPFIQEDTSTSRRYGGTGLGLAICQNLVSLMGGQLSVQSVKGRGSVFTFTLRARALKAPMANTITVVSDVPKTILLADDNERSLTILMNMLKTQTNITVAPCSTLDEVHQYLDTHDCPSMVILDYSLSKKCSPSVLNDICSHSDKKFPIVLLAPAATPLRNRRELGITSVIYKPTRSEILYRTLQAVLYKDKKNDTVTVPVLDAQMGTDYPLKILLVEDNLVNQKVASNILKKLGYYAHLASNGAEALAALDVQPYDVVLMDIQMPEIDGLEATRQLRKAGSTVYIAGMTAHVTEEDKKMCFAVGMDDYVAKPVRIPLLVAVLKRAYDYKLANTQNT